MTWKNKDAVGRVRSFLLVSLMAFLYGCSHSGQVLNPPTPEAEREVLDDTRLTSPFLECPGLLNANLELVRARAGIVRYLEGARVADPTLTVSVYARDLNNGPWIGIDEQRGYFPASLSKVPVMLFILDRAEEDHTLLSREVVYPGPEGMEAEDNLAGGPEELRREAGKGYSYEELLFRMIAHSDNHAKELLMAGFTTEDVMALMASMHSDGDVVDGELVMSPRTYSAFFRVLYNATLLGRHPSELALNLLSRSGFHGGIRNHLPEGIVVASKYGLRSDRWLGTGDLSLHECGIVYQPGSPYVLCVMTRSPESSADHLAEIIADISRIVWEETQGG